MAAFDLIRELLEIPRDEGKKRLLLALYEAPGDGSRRYLALSEQQRSSEDTEWSSTRKGITVRRGEVQAVITALQQADFDARPDGKNLSDIEYAKSLDWG